MWRKPCGFKSRLEHFAVRRMPSLPSLLQSACAAIVASVKTLTSSTSALLTAALITGLASPVADAAGTFVVAEATQIETGEAAASGPKWSPDGKWIA